jgi:hypothetical protein|tara:strand:+ start:696 stop:905 length:210 start_codon:yes stop_codon:yes gene_type:complete
MKDWFLFLYGAGGIYLTLSGKTWGMPSVPEFSLPSFFTVPDTINGLVITSILYIAYNYYQSQRFGAEDI